LVLSIGKLEKLQFAISKIRHSGLNHLCLCFREFGL